MTRAGLVGTVLVSLIAIMCVRFGFWQLSRLEQKRARNAAANARLHEPPLRVAPALVDSTGLIFRRVTISGAFDNERTIVIAGRSLNGAPGVHVLTPVRLAGMGVLVNRGWVPSTNPAGLAFDSLAAAHAEDLPGLILPAPRDPRVRPADSATTFRRVWYRPDLAMLREQSPYPLAEYVVQLTAASPNTEYPLRLPPPALDEGPHLGYAIQWFSFAVIAVVGWLILLVRSGALRHR